MTKQCLSFFKRISLVMLFLLGSGDLQGQLQPVQFGWAKQMSGPDWESPSSVATDNWGNVYTTGLFEGTVDFDPGTASYNLTATTSYDLFITKLDSNGNFVWAKQIGIAGSEDCQIRTDPAGNIYISGFSVNAPGSQVDYDPGAGTFNISDHGAFLLKLDSAGNFLFAKQMGNRYYNGSFTFNTSGNIIFLTYFECTLDCDPGPGVYILGNCAPTEAHTYLLLLKLDAAGNFVSAHSFITTVVDQQYSWWADGLNVDASDNILLFGTFTDSVDFDPGPGINALHATASDGFLLQLDPAFNFSWVKQFGGTSAFVQLAAISCDPTGQIYATGRFTDTVDFDPGTAVFHLIPHGDYSEAFVCKLDASGNFVWAKGMGGTSGTFVKDFQVDHTAVYATGYFGETTDFDPGTGINNLNSNGSLDIFLLKLDLNGNFIWARQFGSDTLDLGRGIALYGSKDIYIIGSFQNTADFDPTAATYNLTSAGSSDIAIVKLVQDTSSTTAVIPVLQNLLTLYPNPNEGSFVLNGILQTAGKTATIRVTDITGRTVLQQDVPARNGEINTAITIDRSLPSGLYLVLIDTEDQKEVLKFIKK